MIKRKESRKEGRKDAEKGGEVERREGRTQRKEGK